MSQNFRSYADIETALRPYSERVPLTKGKNGITIDRTLGLARYVGNPESRLSVVHVAGTSGKTTTSYYTAALLAATGKRVGLTISPHIASIGERVQIDGQLLDEAKFCQYFDEYIALVEASKLEPTYFEFMMVFALWVFDREKVDYAVVETGFGGLFDSSNICRRQDKVCIITDIGLDHVAILGSTLGEISAQKAGIIAEYNAVFMYEQSRAVMQPVSAATEKFQAELHMIANQRFKTYFERNFNLAFQACDYILQRDGLRKITEAQQKSAAKTHVPGRLEKIRVGDTMIILDGAHNVQKLGELYRTLDNIFGKQKWPTLLAMKSDKNIAEITSLIADHASLLVFSEFQHGQDMPAHSVATSELEKLFINEDVQKDIILPLSKACEEILRRKHQMILVTGSFYAVAELRTWLIRERHGIVES